MSAPKTAHRSEKSELEKVELFYERVEDRRPARKYRRR